MAIRIEKDLREVDGARSALRTDAGYRACVRRYLAGEGVSGWEEPEAARARFAGCLARLLSETEGEVVAVSHGLVISLYPGLSFVEWQALPMPAVLQTSS